MIRDSTSTSWIGSRSNHNLSVESRVKNQGKISCVESGLSLELGVRVGFVLGVRLDFQIESWGWVLGKVSKWVFDQSSGSSVKIKSRSKVRCRGRILIQTSGPKLRVGVRSQVKIHDRILVPETWVRFRCRGRSLFESSVHGLMSDLDFESEAKLGQESKVETSFVSDVRIKWTEVSIWKSGVVLNLKLEVGSRLGIYIGS